MKKVEKQELDNFIKEKLDIANDISGLDHTPPDRTEKNRQLGEQFAAYYNQEYSAKKNSIGRKREFFIGFAAGAVSLILIGIFILVYVLKPNDEFYYNDSDLVSKEYSLVEFQEEFTTLLPNTSDIFSQSIVVYRNNEKNTNVYAKLFFTNSFGENVQLTIVFVDNYNFLHEQLYSSLTQTGQTSLFSYSYNIIENTISFAKFTCNGYRYYLRLGSETPSNIIPLIESFS